MHDIAYEKNIENQPFRLGFILANPGNIPYKARVRLDIFKDSSRIFTTWSKEISFNIGANKNINIYWFPYNTTGKFKGLLRVYYATEIIDDGSIVFELNNTRTPEDIIKLLSLKTYEKELILAIKSDRDLENIIIIPKNYLQGWFIGQEKIEELKKDQIKNVKIVYDPSLWQSGNKITFQAITEDGRYFGESTFVMNKENSIKTFLHYSLERMNNLLFKIYNIRK